MAIVVRDATVADLPATLAIYNALIPTSNVIWTEQLQTPEERREWFDARLARGFPVLVAEDDGEIVGYTSYGDFRDSIRWPGYRFTVEHSIFVKEGRRGAGVGPRLLGELIDRARAAGIHAMVGGIDAENETSILLHERFGFVEVARMPETGWKHGRWLDLVLMQKLL